MDDDSMAFEKEYFVGHKDRPFDFRHFVALLRRRFPDSAPRARLLEIGCGLGFFLRRVEPHFETWGLDIADYAIKESRKRLHNTKLCKRDASDLSLFEDSFFDVISAFGILEHLETPKLNRCVLECKRVLTQNGCLIATTPNPMSIHVKLRPSNWHGFSDETHVSVKTPGEWSELLHSHGFHELEIYGSGLWDTPLFKYVPSWLQTLLIKAPSCVLFSLGVKFPLKYSDGLVIIGRKT